MATFKFRIDNYPNNGGYYVMRDKWDGSCHLDAAISSGPHDDRQEAVDERTVAVGRKIYNEWGDRAICDGP